MKMALHLYIDLQAEQRKMPHNTNASQLWLAAHLPQVKPNTARGWGFMSS